MKETKTQQMREKYKDYKKATNTRLYHCYDKISSAKLKAFEECEELRHKYCGSKERIISFNRNEFSYGFIGAINEKSAFFYITRENNRFIYLEDL